MIGFEDFEYCRRAFAAELARHNPEEHIGRLLLFPYPNGEKLRWLSVLEPEALVLLQAAGGRIIQLTDLRLSDRVCSYRLDRRNTGLPYWSFEFAKSFKDSPYKKKFIDRGLRVLKDGRLPCMCRTDVTNYYGSICLDILEILLSAAASEASSVSFLMTAIKHWQRSCQLKGLPVGPEASAVVGNLFLDPIDRALEKMGLCHFRYGDDFLVFCENPAARDAVVPLLDGEFGNLRLARSEKKTEKFDAPVQAAANLQDDLISSLGGFLSHFPEYGQAVVCRAFDREIRFRSDVKPHRFRWIVNTLKYKKNAYACLALARQPKLMNIDPRVSADYLAIAQSDDRVLEACMERLSQSPDDRFVGLDLHLLRALSTAKIGTVEGDRFEKIATDFRRLWPVRAWAWAAYASSPARRDGKLMEAAREEKDPNVRRAIVATLKPSVRGRRQRTFIQLAKERFPDSRFTAEWLEAA